MQRSRGGVVVAKRFPATVHVQGSQGIDSCIAEGGHFRHGGRVDRSISDSRVAEDIELQIYSIRSLDKLQVF